MLSILIRYSTTHTPPIDSEEDKAELSHVQAALERGADTLQVEIPKHADGSIDYVALR